MSVKNGSTVNTAVSIVLLTAILGYVVGSLFTVHLLSGLTEAVWTTTVVFAVTGLYLWDTYGS